MSGSVSVCRFPCCGKAYPCDVCHNDAEKDHEMKYANRMICGFCAKEQVTFHTSDTASYFIQVNISYR